MSKGVGPATRTFASLGWQGWVLIGIATLTLAAKAVVAGTCEDAASARDVQKALVQIESSLDPCGESAELVGLVGEFRRCAPQGYRICLNLETERNFTDPGTKAAGLPTTITWNPELRTELEPGCGGDSQRPVLRDPIASLLHEVVHAVQDCRGLDPVEHEFDAVRIENIYRRARGLCQRTRYGEERLPSAMLVSCEPGNCLCTVAERSLTTASQDPNATEDDLLFMGTASDGMVADRPPFSER